MLGTRDIGGDVNRYAGRMDLEILEALALATDRTEALGQLLPGSEDHDLDRRRRELRTGPPDAAGSAILEAAPPMR